MTAGHGDLHQLPLSLVKNYSSGPNPVLKVCDGVEECVKAVREQIRRGAQAIKIHVTGGVLSLIDSPQAAQFSPVELQAMVDEATGRASRWARMLMTGRDSGGAECGCAFD